MWLTILSLFADFSMTNVVNATALGLPCWSICVGIRALEEDLIIWEVEQEPEQNDDEIQLKNPPITPIHFHWRDADVLCGLFWEAMLIMSFQVAIEYRGLKDQVIAQIK